jgi:hypothetical protein
MRKVFLDVLAVLEPAFRRLEAQVPPPVKVAHNDGFKLRYAEKSPQQALLQKFARQISGLHALDILLLHGLAQEQGVIQRTLDEIEEDILFITLGLATGNWTNNHANYLEYFWMEEDGAGTTKRGMVPRDKIRAYVNRAQGQPDPSSADSIGRTLFQAYSGYVHANSVAIVDMCQGDPPRYCLSGIRGYAMHNDHLVDAWNYFYRGLISSAVIPKAFGDEALGAEQLGIVKSFESQFAEHIFPNWYRPI